MKCKFQGDLKFISSVKAQIENAKILAKILPNWEILFCPPGD